MTVVSKLENLRASMMAGHSKVNTNMKKYTVKITEILEREVEVDAATEEKAIHRIEKNYKDEVIILDSSDFSEVDFEVVEEKEMCPDCDVPLEPKMIDLDGTNVEEHDVCPECGCGAPSIR